jgi:hypothetical protein
MRLAGTIETVGTVLVEERVINGIAQVASSDVVGGLLTLKLGSSIAPELRIEAGTSIAGIKIVDELDQDITAEADGNFIFFSSQTESAIVLEHEDAGQAAAHRIKVTPHLLSDLSVDLRAIRVIYNASFGRWIAPNWSGL